MLCGFAVAPPVERAEPMRVPTPSVPLRPVPSDGDDRVAIHASYEVYGLVQTAKDFGVKPSTLVLRLKKWRVRLHGRGWKPRGVKIKSDGANGDSHKQSSDSPAVEMARRSLLDRLTQQLDELERTVQTSLGACGSDEAIKTYNAGRVEMIQIIRLIVRESNRVGLSN